ncbi:uncharacterized protein LOC117648117 [Thrips palmi]|uniref:Uncharacterized protein LOC117648117 n=1 Tax=Thrips palmi TaxID=161013 RepID=A0A6P8Z7W7_THRPL|nr:uncharacterized protein LOC117648117 [Thrips palmi]
MGHVLRMHTAIMNHSRECEFGKMKLLKVEDSGMLGVFYFKCDQCEKVMQLRTVPPGDDINKQLAWGSRSIGVGFAQAQEQMAVLNVKVPSKNTFRKKINAVGKVWRQLHEEERAKAIAEEKKLAEEAGDVDQGIPFITVKVDGGWCRRTYGHGYGAKSGVAVIIGARTKKPLYVGVDNKYCQLCIKARKMKEEPRPHDCIVNYQGPSTGMEADIIIRGLNFIQKEHSVWPKYIVGDGDASVFSRIQQQTTRGRFCEKIECANHAVKNFTSRMHAIAKNTNGDKEGRVLLKPLIPRLTSGARGAIRNNVGQSVDQLRADLWNGPMHVFGEHSQCGAFCDRKDSDEPNNVDIATKTDVLSKVRAAIQTLVNNAAKLRLNETTNHCECFMSLLAKLTGGKRVDLSTGWLYEHCCYAAALAYLFGPAWHLVAWEAAMGSPLGSVAQKVFSARAVENERLRSKRLADREARERGEWVPRRRAPGGAPDEHYGRTQEQVLQEQPDVSDDELQRRIDLKIGELCDQVPDDSTSLRVATVETVGQHNNDYYKTLRKDRVTACWAGDIMSKRDTTCRGNLVKAILYGPDIGKKEQIQKGHAAEVDAKKAYEALRGTKVVECGIFIRPELPHLGASPDGLVGTDGLIEVKNFSKLDGRTILQTFGHPDTRQKLRSVLKFKKKMSRKELAKVHVVSKFDVEPNENSKPYVQVQMQLALSGREWCDLVLIAGTDMEIFRIQRDRHYWNRTLEPTLTNFYYDCLLPEMLDSRTIRGCAPREPQYVIQAQQRNQHNDDSDED